ncbi:hypothetical protein DRJ17_04740 [Candidatus Woesearchaeota archaeon]|nr:MAG: hypothetical protein DRJ17_04740 [Candidatus Woesearchaeota archaeon]
MEDKSTRRKRRKKYFLRALAAAAGIVILGILMFGLEYTALMWNKFFGPRKESVRRTVFKATRSYNEAKLQDLTRYRLQYLRATTEEEKNALASTIRHQFAEYDENKLPPELRDFLRNIKYGG